jgi:ABC-type nitrate/sulfonate/bicarbonate transport system permease component
MVFGAMTISQAYCWTTLVGAEYLAADQGLGYLITMGRRLAMPSMVLLGMICVGLTGVAIGIVIEKVEKRLLAGVRR